MGFPSPAADYADRTITPEILCRVNANCQVIETSTGYAVIDRSLQPGDGDMVLALYDGRSQFAKWMSAALITDDGEAIEGDELDEVTVFGVLTYTINRVKDDDWVV
ncbi:Hypothetical protein AKI40_1219 [Enterobacter sp. FY-07]|uniref:hypothetical protein n=1 Tax=Kosakonia oryzendophytica TaxID=1005665 RepID=UPI000777C470|nr:hypothetical protein [Kosakonia oryzendophytica]AMO47636.1 Hypothetical protein AKI40_1219 [Enterobacter sp. FY-07]WBT59341.1 hypothetical protein O9K67_06015 [Kosakonia oryzendophytica]